MLLDFDVHNRSTTEGTAEHVAISGFGDFLLREQDPSRTCSLARV